MVKALTYGRAGNFFFQLAASIAYAKKHDLEYTVNDVTTDPKWNPLYCQHLRNPNWNPNLETIQVDQPHGQGYRQIPFNESWRDKNIILNGYWQSEKYFKDYKQEVFDAFDFPWRLKKDIVSIHVRRGDYLLYQDKHPPVPIEWIHKAMKEFPGKKFQFFSDDIQYCLENFGERDDCEFSFGKEVEDLIEMSSCEHHICSASTYSLWAYFLNRNQNKKAIFPKLWFMPGWDSWDTNDILPTEIIKL